MASIPLRVYNREIENMIDTGQVDEAAAHCVHILKTIPKHLGTYRLLGKALLENQHYSDAADIFQRVLSSVPDDFIANLGMSIIREDEGNTEAAIWHMERAFETQPANAAIQEELRRLYGKRDGMEPPKVRLTRGALARMYARGHLYVQAIAELRAALSEDPLRPDLQVLLAEMYYLAGQRVESVDICSALLKKFPYCLKANLLLAIILPGTERAQDTQIYRQRVVSLDPYFAKAKPTALSTEGVADNAVNIERLDLQPGQISHGTQASQPSWAATLGIAFSESAGEELPDWLEEVEDSTRATSGEKSTTSVPPFESLEDETLDWDETETTAAQVWLAGETEGEVGLPGMPEEGTDQEDAIPDWMKEAGWGEATGEGQEVAYPFEEEDAGIVEDGDIEKGDIPDWLRGMAPSGTLEDETLEGVDIAETTLPWLEDTEADTGQDEIETPAETGQIEDLQGLTLSEEAGDVADWLKDLDAPAEPGSPTRIESASEWIESESQEEEEIPEWLKDHDAAESERTEELLAPSAPEETTEELPTWITEAPVKSDTEPDELPDWLKDLESAGETRGETETPEELPDWLQREDQDEESHTEDAVAGLAAAGLVAEAADEFADWLEQKKEETGEEAAEVEIAGEPVEGKPEWLLQIEAEEAAGTENQVDIQQPEPGQVEVGEGLATETSDEVLAMPDLNDPEAGMAWLESLAAKQGVPEEQLALTRRPTAEFEKMEESRLETELESTEAELAPTDQIEVVEESTEEAIQTEVEQEPVGAAAERTVEAGEEAPAIPDLNDPDAAMAWLESLAAKQGVPEEQLILTHPSAQETEAESEIEVQVSEPAGEAETASEAGEEKPEWLRQIEAEEEAAEIEALAAVQPTDELGSAIPSEAASTEDKFEWLREMEAGEEETQVSEELAAEGSADSQTEEDTSQVSREQEETEEGMAWLESLAARQGVPQEQLTTRPEDRTEAAPEWVLEQARAAEESPEPALPEEERAEEEEIPAWMRLEEEEESWIPPEPPPSVAKLDLNQASLSQLEELPGIGFIRAQNIVAYRESNGPFHSLDELQNISGVGPELISQLGDLVTVPEPASPAPSIRVEQPQPSDENEARLFEGRGLLLEGNLSEAAACYADLIREGSYLDEAIQDLRESVTSHPAEIDLWQLLGDAYMRNDQFQDALDAYTRAENLLR